VITATAPAHQSTSSPVSHTTPFVFVIDDDVSVRESLEALIHCEGWRTEVFASAQQFLARPRLAVPSCLVLDVTLPDLDGLELQRLIGVERLDMPIIFITGHGDVPMTVRAMKAGALEFLTKPLDTEVLLRAIRLAIELSQSTLTQESQMHALRKRYESLSGREREVIALVVRGHLNKEIGGELGISEITVKAHRGNMMRKMNAQSLAELVTMAGKLQITVERKA
jgi:FixJ family two-component response regulator